MVDEKLLSDTTIKINDEVKPVGTCCSSSKIYQIFNGFIVVLMAISFFILHAQLKSEVINLKAQINSTSVHLENLFLKYDQLSRTINQNDDNNNEQRSQVKKSRYSRSINSENTSKGISLSNNNDDSIRGLRVARSKRDEAREPLFATFIGGAPEQYITNNSHIGPWVKQNQTGYDFKKFYLVKDKKSIEVTANGLYMISVQICYVGEDKHFSYWVLLNSESDRNTRKLTKCSTSSGDFASEASCYTTVIVPMKKGDTLKIQQQEKDRLINLQEGYSYIHLMLLSTDQEEKRS